MENRVGFGPRLLALLIDSTLVTVLGLIVTLLMGLIGAGAGAATGGEEAAAAGLVGSIMASMVVLPIIAVIYFLTEAFLGATPGKMILKLKIGTAEGKNGSVGLYFTRYAIKNISSIIGLIALLLGSMGEYVNMAGTIAGLVIFVGCFLALSASKQALHDKLTKTAVYKKDALT